MALPAVSGRLAHSSRDRPARSWTGSFLPEIVIVRTAVVKRVLKVRKGIKIHKDLAAG
jgi:hypothetical protein